MKIVSNYTEYTNNKYHRNLPAGMGCPWGISIRTPMWDSHVKDFSETSQKWLLSRDVFKTSQTHLKK